MREFIEEYASVIIEAITGLLAIAAIFSIFYKVLAL